jgi:hypothetical protein
MNLEKKLIACSILAITIGIATIAPLAFFMSAKAETTLDKPWFNINVPYAYFTANLTDTSYNIGQYITFNVTKNADAVDKQADTRIEYYQMQVYSDKAFVENLTYFVATNSTAAFDPSSSFSFERENWFNTNTTSGGFFFTDLNETVDNPTLASISDETSGTIPSSNWEHSTVSQSISAVQHADTIYIDVTRLGYVTFNDDSTVVNLADNSVVQHIELTKYGGGYLYNTAIPEEQLAKTNPLGPIFYIHQNP